jgi:hypothetical protein
MRGTAILPASYTGLPGQLRIGNHLFNRLNTGDRLLGEGKTERDRSQQFAIDIDRTTTHTLHNSGLFEGTAGELGEDNGLLWREVFEDTEDLDLELFDPISVEDGTPDSVLAGTDVLQLEKALSKTQFRADKEESGE